jgi:lipid-binding SYLF domain-containing protein
VSVLVCLSLVFFACSALAADKAEKNAKKRADIDAMASKALETVLAKSPSAKSLYDKAYGYAVFDNVKVAIGISGGGGSGVAVPKSGKRVYMKMGTAGIGLGLGGQKYQVVFLFENEQAFKSFVDKGWQADTSAQAAAADKGANAAATFKDGVAFYQLTDEGLMASADVSGTKYWKNDDLNK